jgi:hypothetical protein
MALVQVEYRVPVIAVVDTQTRTIRRVVADGESISRDEDATLVLDDGVTPAEDEDAATALQVVETEEWPAWTHGF